MLPFKKTTRSGYLGQLTLYSPPRISPNKLRLVLCWAKGKSFDFQPEVTDCSIDKWGRGYGTQIRPHTARHRRSQKHRCAPRQQACQATTLIFLRHTCSELSAVRTCN